MNSKQQDRLPLLNELIQSDSLIKLRKKPPDFELSSSDHFAGLVGVGGSFDFESLLSSYQNGIFPWPHDEQVYLWFSPIWRGIIDFNELHISKSLARTARHTEYRFSINEAFEEVMKLCATVPRKGSHGSWIVQDLVSGYTELHEKGYAHSLEAWRGPKLVAGIYGVYAGGSFSAESMFGLESNSSKLCLLQLIGWLKANDLKFLDIQMLTPVTRSFGAKYISRLDFLKRLLALKASSRQLDLSLVDKTKLPI